MTPLDRFMSKVEKGAECWLWRGCIAPNGYGLFKLGRLMGAHRAAHIIFKAPVGGDQVVRHTCDVRNCVNPEHLQLGSHVDNMRDMTHRKRSARGLRQHLAKLSDEKVRELRETFAPGMTYTELGEAFGVSRHTASKVVRGVRVESTR